MRRDGADFAAYVDARWPELVRAVRDQGVPPDAARDVTVDVLSRCRREWREADRYGDIDAVVEDALRRAVHRYAGERDPSDEDADPGPPPTGAELDRLARRRRARAALVVVPVVAVVAAFVGWRATSGSDGLDDAELTRVDNPSRATWYAAGELHLPHAVVRIGAVEDVTRIGDGAVYVDARGRAIALADDGGRELLGHQDPDRSLAASDESGWAAWIDTERHRTVVVDVATGRTLASRTGDERVIAVDGDTVYLRNGNDRLRAWQPDTATTAELEDQPLLDVLGRKKTFQTSPGHVEVVASLFSVDVSVPGTGARLSGGGDFVATRGLYGAVQLSDTRSGRPVDVDLDVYATVIAATGDDRGTVTYVIDTREGRRLLEDCDLRTGHCQVASRLDRTAGVPLLAR